MTEGIQSILFTTDLSEESWSALDTAAMLAGKFQADLHVLMVVQESVADVAFLYAGTPSGSTAYEGHLAAIRERASEELDERLADVRKEVAVHVHVQAAPNARDAILDFTERHEIDLVVIATHGHSGLKRFLLGSTTEAVLRGSGIPVLAVPAVASEAKLTGKGAS